MVRTKKSKEEFIEVTKKRIEARKAILEFVENVYFPMMCTKFDGKVKNVRFIKALTEEANKINDWFYIKQCYCPNEIEIQLRISKWNYNDYESILLKCNTNAEGRIDYDATVNDKLGNQWIDSFKKWIEVYQDSIDHYDEYMAEFEKAAQIISKVNELPHPFRENIDKTSFYLRIY